jgi:hypothetical protein
MSLMKRAARVLLVTQWPVTLMISGSATLLTLTCKTFMNAPHGISWTQALVLPGLLALLSLTLLVMLQLTPTNRIYIVDVDAVDDDMQPPNSAAVEEALAKARQEMLDNPHHGNPNPRRTDAPLAPNAFKVKGTNP